MAQIDNVVSSIIGTKPVGSTLPPRLDVPNAPLPQPQPEMQENGMLHPAHLAAENDSSKLPQLDSRLVSALALHSPPTYGEKQRLEPPSA